VFSERLMADIKDYYKLTEIINHLSSIVPIFFPISSTTIQYTFYFHDL